MKTIVVPTDFSAVATNAMFYAVDMASFLQANLVLFHTYEIPVSYVGTEVPLPIIDIGELEKVNQDKLDEIKTAIDAKTGGSLPVEVELRSGDLVYELEDYCNAHHPFAIVMGTKGAGFVERFFLGSSTLSVIKKLDVPVWVIPPDSQFKKISKLGFACDFRSVADSTPVTPIRDIVSLFGAELLVLNVDYNNKNFRPDTPEQSVILHNLIKELKPRYFFINNEKVEEGISSFAEQNKIDVIITIPKKQTLLDSLFQKSHSAKLAIHSHIPIVAIHE